MRRRIFPATWDGQQREGDVVQIVDEDVNGVRVVKAFGQEQRELERVADAAQAVYGSQMRAVRLQSRYQPLLEAIPTLGPGGHPGLRRLDGPAPPDHPRAPSWPSPPTSSSSWRPARQLAGVLTIGQQARAGVERIFQLLDLPPGHRRRPGRDRAADPAGRDHLLGTSTSPTSRAGRCSRASTCTSCRASGWPSSARAAAASRPLAMLVSRFYDPDQGAVLVDGHDLRGVTLASLRRQVGVVFEESFLFSDSVRANIAYGRPERHRGRDRGGGPGGPGPRVHPGPAPGLRHGGRGAGPDPVGRPAPAHRPGPGHPLRPPHPDPRRRHQRHRRHGGGGHPPRPERDHGRAHDALGRPPALDPAPGRPDRRARRRPGGRSGHPRRADGPQRALPDPADRAGRGAGPGDRRPHRGAGRPGRVGRRDHRLGLGGG